GRPMLWAESFEGKETEVAAYLASMGPPNAMGGEPVERLQISGSVSRFNGAAQCYGRRASDGWVGRCQTPMLQWGRPMLWAERYRTAFAQFLKTGLQWGRPMLWA